MASPSERSYIDIPCRVLEGLKPIIPHTQEALKKAINTLWEGVTETEWKETRERMITQIEVDNALIDDRETRGIQTGTVTAIVLLAGLYFSAPAIAANLLLLFISAFIITVTSVGIYMITIGFINRHELERIYKLETFLEKMPTPQ